MSPQPFSSKYKDQELPFGCFLIGNERDIPAELNALAFRSIASWSEIEFIFLRTYVALMGGKSERAATVYLALDGNSAKRKAIHAVADRYLPPKARSALNAVIKISKENEKRRNKLAHHLWGYASGYPDCLLLVDPRYLVKREKPYVEQVYVYTRADLIKIIEQNHILFDLVARVCRHLSTEPCNENSQILEDLLCEKTIKAVL